MNKNDKKVMLLSIGIIIILMSTRIIFGVLVAGDEFINYYNTLKIFNGERMWEEVNIITTPFMYILGCIIFKIFGTKFIIYKILNFIINIFLLIVLYKTFRNLNINKMSSFIYTSILEITIISYVILWGVTYNVIAIIFCLIGLNLNIKKPKYFNLWQGIIIFLIIFTKHNIGLYYLISQIIIELVVNKKIINLVKQFLVILTGMSIFGIILYKTNLLMSFIDMTIVGVSSFASNIRICETTFLVTLGTIVFLGILIYKKRYDTNNKQNICILSITGTMLLFMAFPIADEWHMILASIVLYIELIYIIDFNGIKLNSNKILIGIDLYLVLFISLNTFYNISCAKNGIIKLNLDKESTFYLSFIKNPDRIEKIEEFIKTKQGNVLIISPEAGIYSLDLNLKSNGFFDEPFNGNLGSNQFDKMVDKLNSYEDSYILIHTSKKYLQEIDEFRDYIKENYKKIDEVEDFSIYKK